MDIPFYKPVCDCSFTRPDLGLWGFTVVVEVLANLRDFGNLKLPPSLEIVALAMYLDLPFLFEYLKCESLGISDGPQVIHDLSTV